MKEQQRTVRELQALLREQFGCDTPLFVELNPDNTFGWNDTVVAAPRFLLEIQRRAYDIEAGVRAQFGLQL
jgi:hypothetical protein